MYGHPKEAFKHQKGVFGDTCPVYLEKKDLEIKTQYPSKSAVEDARLSLSISNVGQ